MTNSTDKKPAGWLINLIFHIMVLIIILLARDPQQLPEHTALQKLLWMPSNKPYLATGAAIGPFKAFLPKRATVSIVTDDLENSAKQRELWYGAQNFLAPLLITKEEDEALMIVYCSNDAIAEEKMKNAGYRWFKHLADGKGVAIKNL
ncbi:MAG: hypothetical protein H6757_02020 [Candidatus Omnitrophica bacterium]|nr:hypothetical protein [Candidatus Omnitrophota bacterium]